MDTVLKQRVKQALRSTVGEPYVGKRLKLRNIGRELPALHLNPTAILDAGAEDATFVYWLADRYPDATVTAVDIDPEAIDACTAARPDRYAGRVHFRLGYFADLEPESFDLITAFDVLEHIEDDDEAVADLYRALKPGGTLLVHVPHERFRHLDGREERVPDELVAETIHPGHVRQGYGPGGLSELVHGAGFTVVSTTTWTRLYGTRAFALYERLERFAPLRLLTLPFTDLAAVLDRGRPEDEGNSVWLHAVKG